MRRPAGSGTWWLAALVLVPAALIALGLLYSDQVNWDSVAAISTALAVIGTAITFSLTERRAGIERAQAEEAREARRIEDQNRDREEREAALAAGLRVDLRRVIQLVKPLRDLTVSAAVPFDVAGDIVDAMVARLPPEATVGDAVGRLTEPGPFRALIIMDAGANCDLVRHAEETIDDLQEASVALRGSLRIVSEQVAHLVRAVSESTTRLGLRDVFEQQPGGGVAAGLAEIEDQPLGSARVELESLLAIWAATRVRFQTGRITAVAEVVRQASMALIELGDAELVALSLIDNEAADESELYIDDLRFRVAGLVGRIPASGHAKLADLVARLERSAPPRATANAGENAAVLARLARFPSPVRGPVQLGLLQSLGRAEQERIAMLARDERSMRMEASASAPGLWIERDFARALERHGLLRATWPPRVDADGDRFYQLTSLGREVARFILAEDERPGYAACTRILGREDNGLPERADAHDDEAVLAVLRTPPDEVGAATGHGALAALTETSREALSALAAYEIACRAGDGPEAPALPVPSEATQELIAGALAVEWHPPWTDEYGNAFVALTSAGREVARLLTFEGPPPPHLADREIPGRDAAPAPAAAAADPDDASVLAHLLTPPLPREAEMLAGLVGGLGESGQRLLVEFARDEVTCRQPGASMRPGLQLAAAVAAELVAGGLVVAEGPPGPDDAAVHVLTPLGREAARLVIAALAEAPAAG